ncbi:MAG: hypothetical protein V1837_04225 [Candidatus Woesearchaeota archaeon]
MDVNLEAAIVNSVAVLAALPEAGSIKYGMSVGCAVLEALYQKAIDPNEYRTFKEVVHDTMDGMLNS